MKKSNCMLALIVGSLVSASSAFAASDWEWQVPPATGNDLLSVTYTGTDFYAVGRAGVIVTSKTGVLGTWTHIPSPSIPTPIQKKYDFTAVAGTGKTVVAVAATPQNAMMPVGYIVTSTDGGTTWNVTLTATTDRLIGVTYSMTSKQFVAVGGGDNDGGLIYQSPDGKNWTRVGTKISGVEFDAVASNGAEIAAIGRDGVVYMSLDSTTLSFTAQTVGSDTTHTEPGPVGKDLHAIVGNPGNRDFYAVGEGSTLMHFAPGTTPGMGTWTTFELSSLNIPASPSPNINPSLRGIGLQGSTYLVTGTVTNSFAEKIHITESGTQHAYEVEKWTPSPNTTEQMSPWMLDSQPANSIATNGKMFVAVGDNGTITTTPDAVNWTFVSKTASDRNDPFARLHAIDTDGTRFVAGGENGEVLQSSDGGITWSPEALPDPHVSGIGLSISALKFGASQFVAVTGFGNTSGTIYTSPTGETWTETLKSTPVTGEMTPPKLLGLDYDKTHRIFVAVGRSEGGANVWVSQDDGNTWTVTEGDSIVTGAGLQSATAVLTSVVYDSTDQCFLAVGLGNSKSVAVKGTVGGTAPNYTITWTKFGSPFSDAGSLPNNVIPTAVAWSEKHNVFVVSGGVESDTGETVVSNAGATTASWTDENGNLPAGIDHVLGLAYNKFDDTFIGLGKGSLLMTRPAASVGTWTLQNTGAQRGNGPLDGEGTDVFFGALAIPGSVFVVGGFVETGDTISKIMHLQTMTTPVRLQEFTVD
jgi:hypothetical protein